MLKSPSSDELDVRLVAESFIVSHHAGLERCGPDAVAADLHDCHAYTLCFAGRLYRFSCGPKSSFDAAIGACVSAKLAAGCDVTGSTASTQNQCMNKSYLNYS